MRRVFLSVLLMALNALSARAQSCVLLSPPGLTPNGQLGCSVDLHVGLQGAAAALGANLGGDNHTGSVTLCLLGTNWECEPPLQPTGGQPGDQFGRSVAVDDDWLFVGAPFANGSGIVYVYRRDGGSLTLKQTLTASDAARGDQFGLTLALSGNTLIVGAPNNVGTGGSLSGAIYVFNRNGDTWTQGQKLTASDAKAFDNFGFSLATDGSTILIGAPFHDEAAGNSGAAYVFEQRSGSWSQQTRLTASDGAPDDEYGSAVSVSGSALVVGARADDVNGMQDAGSAYVYEKSSEGWKEVVHLFGEAAEDRFGVAASISGDQLVIGALLHDGGTGAAYLFVQQADGTWVRAGDPIPGDAKGGRFGQAVSTNGGEALVGAYLARGTGSASVCPFPVPTHSADLGLTISAPASTTPGQTITYTLTVTNHGPDNATGIQLEDPIPPGLQPVGRSRQSPCRVTDGNVVCTLPDDLPSEESRTVFLDFTVQETCTTGIVNQQATVSAIEKDPNPDNNKAPSVSTAVVFTADLMISKTAPSLVKSGDPIPYVLTVKNLGPDVACGVVVSDPIPARLTSPVLPSGCSVMGGTVLCKIAQLPVGPPSSFSVGFTAPPGATCGRKIINRATISAVPPTADPQPANNDSGPVTTTIAADLSITKTVSQTTASPGDILTYTIVVNNPSGSLVTVTDVFPPGLTLLTGCQVSPCLDSNGGDFHEVVTGSSATYQVQALVSPTFTGKLVNTAYVMGPPECPDPDSSNNSAAAMTQIVPPPPPPPPPPGVTILCGGIDGSQVEGEAVVYTVLLRNGGPATQANAMFSDLLPAGLTPVSVTPSSGTATVGNLVTWSSTIPVGGTVTITITAMIAPKTAGMTFCNAPTVTFDQDGDGTNESNAVAVPCCFRVLTILDIPALGEPWLATLALLLALLALRRLTRDRAGNGPLARSELRS